VIGNATLYHGDCLDLWPTIGRVDAVITDPPYGKEVHAAGKRVKKSGGIPVICTEAIPFKPIDLRTMKAVGRLARETCDGWLIVFSQVEQVYLWQAVMLKAGLKYRRAMAWVKPDSPPQLSGDRPAQGFECMVASWCGQGRSVWNGGGRRGVFTHATRDDNAAKLHPTAKPVALMAEIVGLFSQPGARILDPFMGSATTGVPVLLGGGRFVGIEENIIFFDRACFRIEQLQRQLRMFA